MITQNIHVRMDAYGIPPVIHAVEGDTWRYLDIYTDDAAINTSNTAVVAIHRPDDSYYTIEAMPEPLFYHLEMDQALTRPGKVECQLKVSSGDLVISTYTFHIVVEPSTTGLPTEQLGYDIYDLIDAAQQIQNVGLTEEIKQALLDCFEHVAWTDEHGQDYVDALEAALYPPAELVSISAVYTQSGTVYTTDSLDSLKSDLVVTATYTDSTTETVTTYTLSGTLTEGTSVITVSYGGKTTTFNVTVTAPATLSSITAVYTQSGTVYDTDTLDSLKTDLVVTAVYSDSTTQTVASTDYTLSGTLTEGTSTITVSYGGKTDTFDVTVTHVVSEEVISTFTANSNFDNTTFEQTSDTNTWTAVSTINASKITFAWDTTLHDIFQARFCQYDSNGTPYKLSALNRYPDNPVTDGSAFDTKWNNPGGAGYFTAVGSGSITINLPTSGIVKMAFRKGGSGGSEVTSNATFGEWLNNGRLTITAHI